MIVVVVQTVVGVSPMSSAPAGPSHQVEEYWTAAVKVLIDLKCMCTYVHIELIPLYLAPFTL